MSLIGPLHEIVDPGDSRIATSANLLKVMFSHFDKFEGPANERIVHWENNWKINPIAGLPPVLTDWMCIHLENIVSYSAKDKRQKVDIWFAEDS